MLWSFLNKNFEYNVLVLIKKYWYKFYNWIELQSHAKLQKKLYVWNSAVNKDSNQIRVFLPRISNQPWAKRFLERNITASLVDFPCARRRDIASFLLLPFTSSSFYMQLISCFRSQYFLKFVLVYCYKSYNLSMNYRDTFSNTDWTCDYHRGL